MKKIACKELGDPRGPMTDCDHVFEAETFEELLDAAIEHVKTIPVHERDLQAMNSATDPEKQQWMEMARTVFDHKPDA